MPDAPSTRDESDLRRVLRLLELAVDAYKRAKLTDSPDLYDALHSASYVCPEIRDRLNRLDRARQELGGGGDAV